MRLLLKKAIRRRYTRATSSREMNSYCQGSTDEYGYHRHHNTKMHEQHPNDFHPMSGRRKVVQQCLPFSMER